MRIQAETAPARPDAGSIQHHLDRERLALAHLVQVRCIAQKLSSRLPASVELNDLVSAGVLGLLDAIDKFDPSRAVKFKTYAEIRVRGAILDSLRRLDWCPRPLRRKGRQLESTREDLEQRLGRSPTEQEICERMNIPLEELHELVAQIQGVTFASFESCAEQGNGRKDGIRHAYIPEAPERGPFWLCHTSEIQDRLTAAIATLPRRERLVVLLYYFEEMSMERLGRVIGVSRGAVSFILSKAIGRLRIRLNKIDNLTVDNR
jgi:RNA polymerase sigma factor FliA